MIQLKSCQYYNNNRNDDSTIEIMAEKFTDRGKVVSEIFHKIHNLSVREIYIGNWIEEVVGYMTGSAAYIPSFLYNLRECIL